jgi:hypothetical protein
VSAARLPELALAQTLFDPVLPFTIVDNRVRFRAARAKVRSACQS